MYTIQTLLIWTFLILYKLCLIGSRNLSNKLMFHDNEKINVIEWDMLIHYLLFRRWIISTNQCNFYLTLRHVWGMRPVVCSFSRRNIRNQLSWSQYGYVSNLFVQLWLKDIAFVLTLKSVALSTTRITHIYSTSPAKALIRRTNACNITYLSQIACMFDGGFHVYDIWWYYLPII